MRPTAATARLAAIAFVTLAIVLGAAAAADAMSSPVVTASADQARTPVGPSEVEPGVDTGSAEPDETEPPTTGPSAAATGSAASPSATPVKAHEPEETAEATRSSKAGHSPEPAETAEPTESAEPTGAGPSDRDDAAKAGKRDDDANGSKDDEQSAGDEDGGPGQDGQGAAEPDAGHVAIVHFFADPDDLVELAVALAAQAGQSAEPAEALRIEKAALAQAKAAAQRVSKAEPARPVVAAAHRVTATPWWIARDPGPRPGIAVSRWWFGAGGAGPAWSSWHHHAGHGGHHH